MFATKTSRLVAGAAMAVVTSSAAFAGGYVEPVIVEPVVEPSVQTAAPWAGVYGGLALGYVFGTDDRVGVSDETDSLLNSPGQHDLKGPTYGVQLGYRWQAQMGGGRNIVLGPQLSYETGDVTASFDAAPDSFGETEMKSFIALRMKAGLLNAAQDTMFYGIAGVGRGDFDYAVTSDGLDYDGEYSDNAWILGLGAERRVTDRISLFGEWEYRQFGKTTLTGDNGYMTEATPEQHHIQLGLNFSF